MVQSFTKLLLLFFAIFRNHNCSSKAETEQDFLSNVILVFTRSFSAFAAVYVDVVMEDLAVIGTLQCHLLNVGFRFTTARTDVIHGVLFH